MQLGNVLLISTLFALGAAVGSFLNVLIYRTIEGESWVGGRSKCDHCKKRIAWYDNIPLLSFLWLRGKARCCDRNIPRSYPLVELITGVLFVWWYFVGFFFFKLTTAPLVVIQPLFWLLVGLLLLVIFVADWRYSIIPDIAVWPLFSLTLLYRLSLLAMGIMRVEDFGWALVGMVIAVSIFYFLWWVTKGKGMGFGDVKLAAPVALILGWPHILVGLFVAFVTGGLIATTLLLLGKKKFGQTVPFGPFLVWGTLMGLLWGDRILAWYMQWL